MRLSSRFYSRPIKLYWFRRKSPHERNFGDELSAEIVGNISGRKVAWADIADCEMVAVGSILESVLADKSTNKICVWGAGLMFADNELSYDKIKYEFPLVRGKLTGERLSLESEVYGDPGILASLLYKPSNNKRKISIVPHYVDQDSPVIKSLAEDKEIKVINVFDRPEVVVSEIASSELVISSSLHGVIVAHSFGIPAYWVELSNGVAGEGYKFRDYYSIFNRSPDSISIEKLKDITNSADELINIFQQPEKLEAIKKNIIETFPKNFHR